MKNLIIVRGLPGSGKSTQSRELADIGYKHLEADMYFVRSGIYNFDASKLFAAHNWCQSEVQKAMYNNERIVVSNTFTTKKEIQPYLDLAKEYEYSVSIMECTGEFGSVHGVPEETIEKMRKRWEKL